MTNPVVPVEAVEAAARAISRSLGLSLTDQARAALEAAAPYMLRTVATVEDLDALQVGSVVMGFDDDLDQIVSRKSSSGMWEQAGTDDGYQAAGIIQWHGSVTVLHEPGE